SRAAGGRAGAYQPGRGYAPEGAAAKPGRRLQGNVGWPDAVGEDRHRDGSRSLPAFRLLAEAAGSLGRRGCVTDVEALFEPGERITHHEYGQGVVLDPARDGYLRAFFGVGERRVPVVSLRREITRT